MDNHSKEIEPNGESAESKGETKHSHVARSLQTYFVLFVAIAVLLLGVSWLLFDESINKLVSDWLDTSKVGFLFYSVIIVAVLASDLVLPIPSSAVITHAGIRLGVVGGTAIGFLGITIGSLVGFWLARWLGKRFVDRKVKATDRMSLDRLTTRYGVYVVVFLRPVPILAEASVLLLALGRMSWRPFLTWLSVSNFFVALFFAAFGSWATENQISELVAMLMAIAIPIILLICIRFAFRKHLSTTE